MAKKTITITLNEPDLTLPKHLKKPAGIDLQIVGFTPLECMNLLSTTLSKLLIQFTDQLQSEQTIK
jgi:hypothetical protein